MARPLFVEGRKVASSAAAAAADVLDSAVIATTKILVSIVARGFGGSAAGVSKVLEMFLDGSSNGGGRQKKVGGNMEVI